MGDSCVKVGVRIRPLNSKEKHQNSVLSDHDKETILFKNQTFTLDYVFGPELDQLQMYQSTAAPMLKSFLEGYNVTIMAYGQTGSGKTHTMGTSDSCRGDEEQQGLLPRFVSDLFENLKDLADHDNVESKIKVSFLEIYGEDVHDLTSASAGRLTTLERPSLPVRENDQGQVFVQGLQEQDVTSADQALEVLYNGTQNRTTAATAMNAGSSRSHAVFTITLDQRVVAADDEGGREMTSKLTFVDLAGSERLKRTGAEGQRMKEGIQINSGLFNLGQVINGLADDQRIKKGGKAGHVPYRNSKLTHLLKDALGGNSKTLFLACVSPAEINESETYSTLLYARQARNIQNKPIQNMDKTQAQIRRLKCSAKTWMVKALTLMYGNGGGIGVGSRPPLPPGGSISPLPNGLNVGYLSPAGRASTGQYISLGSHNNAEEGNSSVAQLLQRQDVQDYIRSMEDAISISLNQAAAQTPRKVRLSILATSPAMARSAMGTQTANAPKTELTLVQPRKLFGDVSESKRCDNRRQSLSVAMMDEVESEKLVARMLEMVNKEKEGIGTQHTTRSAGDDEKAGEGEEADNTSKIDEKFVDREIEEKEEILGKLMETVKGYAALKADYEKLMDEISSLDSERRELELALQKAQLASQQSGAKGCGNVERLQERFQKVSEELNKMRSDRSRKETAYKLMQRESKQCDQLSNELSALKSVKVQLQKKQKEQAQMHLRFKKEQQSKMHQLKKAEVKKQQAMNDLKNELTKKQRVLGHKDREISRMQSKLKACEEHITQLLRIQTATRSNGSGSTRSAPTKTPSKASNSNNAEAADLVGKNSFASCLSALELDHFVSSKSVLDNLVAERVERKELIASRELKSNVIKELNDEVHLEKVELKGLQSRLEQLESEHAARINQGDEDVAADLAVEIMHCEQAMQGLQADLDSISREISMHSEDLKEINNKLTKFSAPASKGADSSSASWEDLGKNVVSGLSGSQVQAAVWELLAEKTDAVARVSELQEKLKQTVDVQTFQQDLALQYEKQIHSLQEEMRIKLSEAEKKRVNDVWALLKAQTGPDGEAMSLSTSSSAGNTKGLADAVVIARAQELEDALEVCLASEEQAKLELQDNKKKMIAVEAELAELRVQQLTSSGGSIGNAGVFYDGLKSTWDQLGTHTSQRADFLGRIEKARYHALEQVQNEFQEELLHAKEEELRLAAEIEQLGNILGQHQKDDLLRHDSYTTGTLLGRLHLLHEARAELVKGLEMRARQVHDIQGRLVSLMSQMDLDVGDAKITSSGLSVVVNIPQFPFDEDHIEDRDDELAEELLEIYINKLSSLAVEFSDDMIDEWVEGVRCLSVERASNVARSTSAREEAGAIARLLGFSSSEDLMGTMDLGDVGDLPRLLIETAFDAIFDDYFQPQGSLALTEILERINLVLKTTDINRRGVMKLLCSLASKWNAVIAFNGDDLTISTGVNDVSPSTTILSELFRSFERVWRESNRHVHNFQSLIADITTGLSLSTIDQRERESILEAIVQQRGWDKAVVSQYSDASTVEEQMVTIACKFKGMASIIEELQEMLIFLDEVWVNDSIDSFVGIWKENANNFIKLMILQMELDRVQCLDTAVKELHRLDGLLGKHIKEMEEFEASSKQNRAKLLSGSSKALVEEEKFRKTGKRKYEHLVDRLVATFSQVNFQMLFNRADLLTTSVLKLSHTAVAAIKGKGKSTERTELMHLHTLTHGTKRWSGDLLEVELAESGTSAASAPPLSASKPPSTKTSHAPVGSPVLKRDHGMVQKGSTAAPPVKHSSGSSSAQQKGGNVFADCLTASSTPNHHPSDRDENMHVNQN